MGRSEELAELLAALRDRAVRLVTLTGRGGVGKTRLAIEAAASLSEARGTAVVMVSLAGVSVPELVVDEIARACRVPALPSVDPLEALADYVGDHELLLVLDNFEHLLDAASVVGDLVDRCPGVTFLVTSQASLRLSYEHVLSIDPLPLPEADASDPDVLAQQPAAAIYCARAAAVDRSFRLTRANAVAVAQLCCDLEGLPLAIELAAARAPMLPAAELRQRLDATGLDLLRHAERDAPVRHHDLRAAINCTYQLLGTAEQCLLRRLSLVSGTFDVDVVGALSRPTPLGPAMDQLATLIDLHLVGVAHTCDAARFEIPFSIRRFALDELEMCGEYVDARRAHVAIRADEARAAAIGVASGDEGCWLRKLELDQADLVAALDTAIGNDLVDDAIDLVVALAPLWDMRGYHEAQEERVDRALKLGRHHDHVTASLSQLLSWSALLGLHHGATIDQRVLLDRLRDGEAMARDVHDDEALLRSLAHTTSAMPYSLDLAGAQRAAAEGLELAARSGNERWLSKFEAFSGMLANQRGDDERAMALGRAAATRARRVGDRRALVLAALLLLPLRRQYPHVASPSLAHEALDAARDAQLTLYEGLLLQNMVSDAVLAGDRETALRLADESLELALTMPNASTVGFQLLNIAHAAASFGDDEQAAFLYGTIRDWLPTRTQHLSPAQSAAYERRLAAVRGRLGARFETEAHRGAQLTNRAALEDALAYVTRARDNDVALEPRAATLPGDTTLTNRQHEVLRLLVAGLGNKEIATRLHISPKTVMHHTTAIYKTLNVRTRGEAAVVAVRSGLVH
jgi:predicted ATPase/DNA-binding CsgD family transcriptional regulator